MRYRIFWILLFSVSLFASKVPHEILFPTHPIVQAPWFTGPLLAPSTTSVPRGHLNFESYVYVTATTGTYNNHWHSKKQTNFWELLFQNQFQIGLNRFMDFEITPAWSYNYSKGAAHWTIDDLPIGLDIQLYQRHPNLTSWGTSLLLNIQETIPIGKYRNLNPNKRLTDVGGQGSWQTAFTLNWGNHFYLGGNRFLSWRSSLKWAISAPVHVINLNVYGGGAGTNGTVYPGQILNFDTAIEVTLNRNWVFACDLVGNWSSKNKFSGTTTVPNDSLASVQYSLAPALEYNWNANLGIIFGCWFTFAGKNSSQFRSAVAALNYYH